MSEKTFKQTWVVYDTDGDGRILRDSYEYCDSYDEAESKYRERLFGIDWATKGFLAAPHFSCAKVEQL